MNYIHFESLPSTNDYVKEHLDQLTPPCIIHTDIQTKGRGRRDHQWISENDLMFSYLTDKEAFHASMQMALSILYTLHFYHLKATVKWPNDIFINDRKIAGILTETLNKYTIIGTGLNITNSLYLSLNHLLEYQISSKDLLNKIMTYYTFLESLSLDDIIHTINKYSYLKNKKVNYLNYGITQFLHLNTDGTLTILDEHQKIHHIILNQLSLSQKE